MNESTNFLNSDYFYTKCIWAIAFSDKPKQQISYLFNFLGIDGNKMVTNLDVFLDWNYTVLERCDRDNLHLLVRFLRNGSFINDKSFDLLENKIEQDFDLTNSFIVNEYEKRYMSNISNDVIYNKKDEYFNKLRSLFVNDLDVLITHSRKCDNSTFDIKSDKYIKYYVEYIGSINKIIDENPSLLNDELFVSRVKFVFSKLDATVEPAIQKTYTKVKDKLV